MPELEIDTIKGGIVFGVKVVPGSSRTVVSGLLGKRLKIKVAAAAEKGKANQCLVEFLAAKAQVRKNAVSITSGQTGMTKTIRITGLSREQLLERLELA
ncbi:MAG: DUF167 domain-containing protein [Planctomycetota bacterium]